MKNLGLRRSENAVFVWTRGNLTEEKVSVFENIRIRVEGGGGGGGGGVEGSKRLYTYYSVLLKIAHLIIS